MIPQTQFIIGDALEQLRLLPDESVHCCVTSPPYWGLRDYGVAGQIGLEKTPEEYVAKMVEVFREVRRVLRSDGTCWVNLGDSYASHGGGPQGETGVGNATIQRGQLRGPSLLAPGLKPKDLCGIPWRVAFALQADGWWLRQDIIWHKPNPMPESATDRCTKAHEYLFLLAKSERYYFDAEAIKEPQSETTIDRFRNGCTRKPGEKFNKRDPSENLATYKTDTAILPNGRNKRSVWTVPTAPYSDAHFATFPPDLIKPCIMAGTSARGCCPKCGAPWERVLENGEPDLAHQRACGGDRNGNYFGVSTKDYGGAKAQDASATKARILAGMVEKKTIGWQPTCECGETQTVPCAVLDPFGGSGTTGMVANELGRNAILIDLNPVYGEMQKDRVLNETPGLALA